MREILFRGRRIDNGEWVEGYYVRLYGSNGRVSRRIYTPYAEVDCGDYFPDFFGVQPSTIGQYTGLADKNGKKIFEGDIVAGCDFDEVDGYGVVEWNDGAFEITNRNLSGTFHSNYWGYWFEVIGNIHDNPELLEVSHE